MAKNKKFTVWFKVPGFKQLRFDVVVAKDLYEALDKFKSERPFAIPTSVS